MDYQLEQRLTDIERKLENYASPIEPKTGEFVGQTWYDQTTGVLNNWTGREFKPAYGENIIKDLNGFETRIAQNEYAIEFEVLTADNVIASINLSEEGVNILGDKITLNGDVTVHGTFTIDQINDGTTYGRVKSLSLIDGQIKLDETVNGTYSKILSTAISAGLIKLDETVNGTYSKVLSTSISAGKIILQQVSGDLDDINDGSTYRKTTLNEKTGAYRGYNALNTSYRYKKWLYNGDITESKSTSGLSGVVMDSSGLSGYKDGVRNFEIDTSGNAYFRGDLAADSGYLKTLNIEGTLTMNETTGIIQSSDYAIDPGFGAATGWQIHETGIYVGIGKSIMLGGNGSILAGEGNQYVEMNIEGLYFNSYIGSQHGMLTWNVNQDVVIAGTTIDIESITATESFGVEGYLVARGPIIAEAGIVLNNSADIYLLGTGNRIKAIDSSANMLGQIYYSTTAGKWYITDETNGNFYLNP